jgi:acyl-CoA reductase-like NAD-dependent aldehyde dehydrogenase
MNELVIDAKALGAKILNESGAQWDRKLFFPAVMYPVTSAMKLWREEQFGPVIPVATYEKMDEVYDYLEKMHFGQQAAIFTSQKAEVPSSDLTELLDACALSTCRVNLNVQCSRGPDCFPFAGRRSSAMGTISVTEVLRAVSVETMVASKSKDVITNATLTSTVFGSEDAKKADLMLGA